MASHSRHVDFDESGVSNNMENVTATLGADQMADAADAMMVDATLTDAIMTDATMAEHEYTLFCVVVNEDEAFPVMIRPTATVGELKEAIKAKKRHAFERYDANELKLFKVAIPDDAGLVEAVKQQLNTEPLLEPLKPTKKLNTLFNGAPADDKVHIIVQTPLRKFLRAGIRR